jgi:hypothetical protein
MLLVRCSEKSTKFFRNQGLGTIQEQEADHRHWVWKKCDRSSRQGYKLGQSSQDFVGYGKSWNFIHQKARKICDILLVETSFH